MWRERERRQGETHGRVDATVHGAELRGAGAGGQQVGPACHSKGAPSGEDAGHCAGTQPAELGGPAWTTGHEAGRHAEQSGDREAGPGGGRFAVDSGP
jgi:hypothetical protein